MLEISLLQLLCKGIPEGVAYVVGMYALTGLRIQWKQLSLMSGVLILATYLIRLLPIRFGIHTMLILFTAIAIFLVITKTSVIRNIKAALVILAFLIVSEMINLLLLQVLYGSDRVQEIMADNIQKTLYSIPSTVIFILLVVGAYYLRVVRKRGAIGKSGEPNG